MLSLDLKIIAKPKLVYEYTYGMCNSKERDSMIHFYELFTSIYDYCRVRDGGRVEWYRGRKGCWEHFP